ncbi:MAG: hypothetical protein WCV93_01020 [Candidatus Shapirobacteria bacterium]
MFYLLSLISYLLVLISPQPVNAADPGLNLINDPSSAGYTVNQDVQNWVLYAPGSPQELLTADIQANNVVVRIHSSWTETGQLMLGSKEQQATIASEWSQAINQFAASGKTVYVEPFNELEQDYERRAPDGYITLEESISRANNFIKDIKSQLQNATLISPALDPQNPNYPVTSKAFSYFDIISYHPYRSDTAINYDKGPLAGKKFLFTEIGVDKNGLIYDDQAFINFFCGENIISQWQSKPDVLAYFLFTAAPGNFSGGSWTINDNVANAISGKCDQTNLPNPNHRPSVTPLPTSKLGGESIDDLLPPAVNTTPYLHPRGYINGIYDTNAYANLKGGQICTFQASIKQSYSPKKTTTKNQDGSTTTETEPLTVTSVEEEVKVDGPQTNLGPAKYCTYTSYSQLPTHHQQYIVHANRTDPLSLASEFGKFNRFGYNPVTRSMSYCMQLDLKWKLFQEAVRSLEEDKLKRNPYLIANDQQIGTAYHDTGGCRDMDKSGQGAGRPMFMSEYVWGMIKSGKINQFAVKCVQGKIVEDGVPGDVRELLSKQYEGGGYEKRTGIPFWETYSGCYKNGYTYFLATNPGCASANLETTVKNVGAGGGVEPTPYPHTMPNLAAMSSGQAGEATAWWIPYKQQSSIPKPDVCSMGGGYNTQNKPSPLDFVAWVKNLWRQITEDTTLTAKVEVEVDYPANIAKNEGSLTQTYFNLTPQKDQGKLARTGSDSTAGGGAQLPIAHPGAQTDINHDKFYPQLLPASWQL